MKNSRVEREAKSLNGALATTACKRNMYTPARTEFEGQALLAKAKERQLSGLIQIHNFRITELRQGGTDCYTLLHRGDRPTS